MTIGNNVRTFGKKHMKQNQQQRTKGATTPPDESRIQVNVLLEGDDAAKFLRYQAESKTRQKSTAAYRLMMERLDQVQPAA